MPSRLKAGWNHNVQGGNKCLENMAMFKYLRRALTNYNCMKEDIKSTLNPGKACYHSDQNIFLILAF
jgi:hypothetical protein